MHGVVQILARVTDVLSASVSKALWCRALFVSRYHVLFCGVGVMKSSSRLSACLGIY